MESTDPGGGSRGGLDPLVEQHEVMDVENENKNHLKSGQRCGEGFSSISFKQKLMFFADQGILNEEIFLNDVTYIMAECEIDSIVGSDDSNPNIPSISIDLDTRKKICQKWKWCIIGKVQGKNLGFKFMQEKSHKSPTVFKFGNLEDYKKVVFGSPWFILGHFLNLQRWSPNFRPSTTKMEKTVVWARLPELPLEYFDRDILFHIGNKIGQTTTEQVARGRYDRICVEIDTSKALVPCIRIGGCLQKVEYEGLNQMGVKHGKITHKQRSCDLEQNGKNIVEVDLSRTAGVRGNVNEENEGFGPWLLVEDRKKKKANQNDGNNGSGDGQGKRGEDNQMTSKEWTLVSRRTQKNGQSSSRQGGSMTKGSFAETSNSFASLHNADDDDINEKIVNCRKENGEIGAQEVIMRGMKSSTKHIHASNNDQLQKNNRKDSKSIHVMGSVSHATGVTGKGIIQNNEGSNDRNETLVFKTKANINRDTNRKSGKKLATTEASNGASNRTPQHLFHKSRRGLARPSFIRVMKKLIKRHNPTIVVLLETRVLEKHVSEIVSKLGFTDSIIVDPHGFSRGFIPNKTTRKRMWSELSAIADIPDADWMVVGDLNTFCGSHENQGGRITTTTEIQDVLSFCGLIDLGSNGPKFTWNNKRAGAANIKERLDRALVNSNWQTRFNKAQVFHLPYYNSDHRVILVDLDPKFRFKQRPFRFEAIWAEDSRYEDVVKNTWTYNVTSFSSTQFLDNISRIQSETKKWNKNVFGNIHLQIDKAHNSLVKAQNDFDSWPSERAKQTMTECLIEYLRLVKLEETFWRQKSRISWLREGDMNTRFFHTSTMTRRKRNSIVMLKDDRVECINSDKMIENHTVNHFNSLFNSSASYICDSELSNLFHPIISLDLCKDVSVNETVSAVKQLGALKDPGPDGLQGIFYTKYWNHVGPSVIDLIRSFFHSGVIDDRLNKTFIALIPKTNNPTTIKEYKPISLCNFSMKIITKIITKRLRPLLNKIFSYNQHAFIPARSLFDSAILCNEIIHSFKTKKGKEGWMTLKLDLDKAYDMISWDFIGKLLKCNGFDQKFINWVMKCISTVSFQVLINDAPSTTFRPSNGLRQGDPLSPYLFIMCLESLTRMFNAGIANKSLSGFTVARGAPMKINKSKSTLLTYANLGRSFTRGMANALGVQVAVNPGGVNIRDLEVNNLAILAKMAWRIYSNPESVLFNLLKTKYFKTGDFWNADLTKGSSVSWRSIIKGRNALDETSLPKEPVSNFINFSDHSWDINRLQNNIPENIVKEVIALPVCNLSNNAGTLIWSASKYGNVTVKDAYIFLNKKVNEDVIANKDWRNKKVFENVRFNANWVLETALRMANEYFQANSASSTNERAMEEIQIAWQVPNTGFYKINTDGSTNDYGNAGIG
ncbi:uncharacterized protein LOC113280813 [Papaver somniferum]|uniref:uncharacterized protein LOC113280813 n=1 Tax=Papaver somniferum TaxID=3469 RepID=UPI000E703031|nr:uncharacterized protein LOC113280813 [Papaver somniferum]